MSYSCELCCHMMFTTSDHRSAVQSEDWSTACCFADSTAQHFLQSDLQSAVLSRQTFRIAVMSESITILRELRARTVLEVPEDFALRFLVSTAFLLILPFFGQRSIFALILTEWSYSDSTAYFLKHKLMLPMILSPSEKTRGQQKQNKIRLAHDGTAAVRRHPSFPSFVAVGLANLWGSCFAKSRFSCFLFQANFLSSGLRPPRPQFGPTL